MTGSLGSGEVYYTPGKPILHFASPAPEPEPKPETLFDYPEGES